MTLRPSRTSSAPTRIIRASALPLASSGRAPTSFRIWRPGANPTDMGVHRFTPRSARLLLTSQAQRGNICSIDYDHLSLERERPATAG